MDKLVCHTAAQVMPMPYLVPLSYNARLSKVFLPGCAAGNTENNTSLQKLEAYRNELELNRQLLAETCSIARVGGWYCNLITKQLTWTPGAYAIYEKPETYEPLCETLPQLFHPDCREQLRNSIEMALREHAGWELEGKLLFENGRCKWVKIKGEPVTGPGNTLIAYKGFVMDINDTMLEKIENNRYREALEVRDQLLNEVGAMAHIGGWKVDLQTRRLYWTREVFRIHELADCALPSLDEAFAYYTPKSQMLLRDAVKRAQDYLIPYDLELELITATGKKIWIRSIGKTILDENGKAKALFGTIQNIQDHKIREAQLQEQHNIIKEQKERLENFAHIVSHNLRSHAASFSVSLEVLPLVTEAEKEEIFHNMERISQNLHETLYHLNEVIKIKNDCRNALQTLYFSDVYEQALHVLELQIKKTGARISCDFSECYRVQHIPAYLESIMLNLISNALKYRHPDRVPEIMVRACKSGDKTVLAISDNGLGIDLQKNGHKIFGMYKTFHSHPDAKGIGLFITKSQIETVGGTIEVESKVNEGSCFIITML